MKKHLSDQPREQRIGGDVEGHSQPHVRAALVHLTRELSFRHKELAEHVTRGQGHLSDVLRIPGGKHDASVFWVSPVQRKGTYKYLALVGGTTINDKICSKQKRVNQIIIPEWPIVMGVVD